MTDLPNMLDLRVLDARQPQDYINGWKALIEGCGSDDAEAFGFPCRPDGYHIQQDPTELAHLLYTLIEAFTNHERIPRNYLGIGIAAGGTERLIVESLSLPHISIIDDGTHPRFPIWRGQNSRKLSASGVTIAQYIGDSHGKGAEDFLTFGGKIFDIVGIDGDHTPAGVRMDWALIRPFVQPGTLVWFHDIACLDAGQSGAAELWASLKKLYKVHLDIGTKFGIGLIEI